MILTAARLDQVERLTRQRYTRRHGHSPEAFQVRARSRTFEEEEERSECREARHCQAGASNQEARRGRGVGSRNRCPPQQAHRQSETLTSSPGNADSERTRKEGVCRTPTSPKSSCGKPIEWRCSSRLPPRGTSRPCEAYSRKTQVWFASRCRMGRTVVGRDCTRRPRRGHAGAVRLLLAHGADPNAREAGDNTYPLHWAVAQWPRRDRARLARRRRGRSRVWRRARTRCHRLGDLLSCPRRRPGPHGRVTSGAGVTAGPPRRAPPYLFRDGGRRPGSDSGACRAESGSARSPHVALRARADAAAFRRRVESATTCSTS